MGCITKTALFIVNLAIFAAGVAVVAMASVIIHKDSSYGSLLTVQGIFTLPIIVLLAGLVIVIIGFLGCCGAAKGSSCMLYTYGFIILVLLLAEVTLGILLLVYPKQAEDTIKEGMKEMFNQYGSGDEALSKAIDAMESDLKCCGVENYTDWQDAPYGSDGNVTSGCCINDDGTGHCFKDMNDKPVDQVTGKIYTQGCYYALKDDLKNVTVGLVVVLFIMAIVQVLAITCACGLAKKSSGSTHYA